MSSTASADVVDMPVGPRSGSSERPGWMRHLAEHYGRARRAYPVDELCIVFDIDGTIIDTRHVVVRVLLTYDREHGTTYFRGLVADDIIDHEDDIDRVLGSLDVPSPVRDEVAGFYRARLWDRDATMAGSRPTKGSSGSSDGSSFSPAPTSP